MAGRLDIGPDVAPVLRPEETARLRELRAMQPLPCTVCDHAIDAGSDDDVTVSMVLDGEAAVVQFAHAGCAPSHADLAALVTSADAEPLGISYVQALHPSAGAVLVWERRVDVRVPDAAQERSVPFLEAQRVDGFQGVGSDEPVRELAGRTLAVDGPDLVLLRAGEPVERFHDAAERAPDGWLDLLGESGYGLLIVGADLGLRHPRAEQIQQAMRAGLALVALVEFRDS
jgi:hypothetical protein